MQGSHHNETKAFLAGGIARATPGIAFSQAKYPERAIRMVVPGFAPGGATTSRPGLPRMRSRRFWPAVVDGKSRRGGGNIGVAPPRLAADGYTLMMGTQALLTQNPYLYADLAKNPQPTCCRRRCVLRPT